MREPLRVKVRKIGTSYGVIISKDYLDRLQVSEGDTLLIKEIEPVKPPVSDVKGMFPDLKFEREHRRDRI